MAKKPPRKPPSEPLGPLSAGDDAVNLPPKKTSGRSPTDRASRDQAKQWQERLTRADKKFKRWNETYTTDRLLRYYLGQHWRGLTDTEAAKKYVINLIFATIETQLPSLLFSKPKVTVDARPDHALTPNSDAPGRARLIEDTLQTFIDDRKLNFKNETTLALRDVYWRFGLIEVGYSADWIDNPHADKPILKEDESPMLDTAGEPVLAPKRLPKHGSETLYLKRISPTAFRCSPGRNNTLDNDWAGYGEWHYIDDVKRNPDYQHTDDLNATGRLADVSDEVNEDEDEEDREDHKGQVRIWKLWDFRQKQRIVLAEGHPYLLQTKPFTFFPVAPIKFYEIPDSWYPLPPVSNWIGPQDELNESREMQRVHRRRATRRYMRAPQVKKEEFEKLESAEDMVCIEVPTVNPPLIAPIPDAPLDAQNWQQLAATREDLDLVTGVTGEGKGVAQSDTATQANIINVRAELRENSARTKVGEWLGDICRLMLLTIRDQMQLPMLVKRSLDPFGAVASVVQSGGQIPPTIGRTVQQWAEVRTSEIDDLDVDVKIDIASLSPVATQAQAQQWFLVLQLMSNQPLMMLLFQPNPEAPQEPSPMLRHTLELQGIKNDQLVREIWRVGQAALQQMIGMQLAQQAAKGGGAGMPGLPAMGGAGVQAPAIPSVQPAGTPTAGPLGVQ